MRRATTLLGLVGLVAGLAGCGAGLQGQADTEAVELGHRVTKDLNGYVVAGKLDGQPVTMARVEAWLKEPPSAYYLGRDDQSHQLVAAEGDGRFVIAAFVQADDKSWNDDHALGRACLRLTVTLGTGVRDEVIDCPANAPAARS